MNFKTISALTLASVCSFSHVNAETFSYSYIEGGFADYIDEAEGVTFLVGGSYNVSSNFNLLADFSTTTLDSEGSVDLDFDIFSVGVGFHTPVNDKTDFLASLQYVSAELVLQEGFASAEVGDVDGYSLGLGLRHKLSDKVEANIGVEYIDIEDESDTEFTIGGRYYFNEKFSAALNYTTGDFDGLAGTLRYDFK